MHVCVVYKYSHSLHKRVLKETKKAHLVLNTDLSVIQWFLNLVTHSLETTWSFENYSRLNSTRRDT